MIVLYQFEMSPFCDKIRRILNFKRIPYETREVGLLEAMTSYRKINPAGKVPALVDGGRTVCDSTDIAYYLEERYPDRALLPSDPAERALVHVFEDWADESVYFLEIRFRFGLPHNRARSLKRLLEHENALVKGIMPWVAPLAISNQLKAQGIGRKSVEQAIADLGRHLDAVEARLSGRQWLVGENISLADIAVFAQFFAVRDSEEGAREFAKRPRVSQFMDRVDQATAKRP